MKKVVLAFSGGLDTSYCAIYLAKEMGLEVHAALANTGGFSAEELARKENLVIACGGGAVLREQNMELLKQSGVVYYLDRPVERIAGDIRLSTRPLLKQGKERLYQLYRERAELYENAADEIVSNEGAVKQTMQRLIDSIKRREALL